MCVSIIYIPSLRFHDWIYARLFGAIKKKKTGKEKRPCKFIQKPLTSISA